MPAVIVIIAILAGLLLPALAKQTQGATHQVREQLKQIDIGMGL